MIREILWTIVSIGADSSTASSINDASGNAACADIGSSGIAPSTETSAGASGPIRSLGAPSAVETSLGLAGVIK